MVSYLLVIYYQREKSYNAGILTALTNRLGDVGLLLIISLIFQRGSRSFIFFRVGKEEFSSGIVFILILVAFTKSAQMPFSS